MILPSVETIESAKGEVKDRHVYELLFTKTQDLGRIFFDSLSDATFKPELDTAFPYLDALFEMNYGMELREVLMQCSLKFSQINSKSLILNQEFQFRRIQGKVIHYPEQYSVGLILLSTDKRKELSIVTLSLFDERITIYFSENEEARAIAIYKKPTYAH